MTTELFFPPGPQKSLIFGNAAELQRNPLAFMTQSARTYGEIVHFRFGPSHAYLLTNPAHAHYALAERPDLFTDRINVLRALNSAFGHDLFPPKDIIQRRNGPALLFQSRWLDALAPEMARIADATLAGWADGGDVTADVQALALDVAARVVFDAPSSAIAADVSRAMTLPPSTSRFQASLMLDWLPTRAARRRSQLRALVDTLLRTGGAGGDGLLARLVDTAAQRGDSPALQTQVRDEAVDLFLAAYEMTANTLCWALHLLARAPETLDALTAEADMATSPDTLVLGEMAVRETLRLYPPVWLVFRQAVRETRIGDYYLPSGSTVYVSPYITQRSPRYFVTPEAFIPERFASGYDRRLPRNAYMPFGAGPRAALMQPVVLLQTKLLLAAIVQRFALVGQGGAVTADAGLALRPTSDLRVRLQARAAAGVNSRLQSH